MARHQKTAPSGLRWLRVAVYVLVAVGLALLLVAFVISRNQPATTVAPTATPTATAASTPSPSVTPSPTTTTTPTPTPTTTPTPTATPQSTVLVRPKQLHAEGIGKFPVLQLPRVWLSPKKYHAPAPPPGDSVSFAYDLASARPGASKGVSIFVSHTYGDGSATADALLASLAVGGEVTVGGDEGEIPYVVTQRLSVPVEQFPSERIYREDGAHAIVIIVCSGTRLGPGEWSERTYWIAKPKK